MDVEEATRVGALLELAAVQAVFGVENVILSEEYQHLVDLAASGTLEEEAAAAQLGATDVDATIRFCTPNEGAAGLHHRPEKHRQQQQHRAPIEHLVLELRVSLPPTYPSPPSAQSSPGDADAGDGEGRAMKGAARCIVGLTATDGGRGGGLRRAPGREWVERLESELRQLARQAAREGQPCLHELCERAQGALRDLEAEARAAAEVCTGASPSGGQQAAPSPGCGAVNEGDDPHGHQVLLLRLDHMHNRALYGRTIGSWIRELRLTGRLIFQGSLILILLEGDGEALKDYLVRHRTESVDVDSRGRKCKERMMDVIVQQPLRLQNHRQQDQRGSHDETTPAAASSDPGSSAERAFPDYREVQLDSLEQVGQLLRRAGLEEWLRPAAGLR